MKSTPLMVVMLVLLAAIPAGVVAGKNEPPLVDAGLDQNVRRGTTVYLDGGGAVDPDGEIVAYEWRIETPRGEQSVPEDPNAETTRFVPDEVGRYRVTLTVTDGDGATESDTLYVDVRAGRSPPAEAPDETGATGSTIAPITSDPGVPRGTTPPENRPPTGEVLGPDSVYAGTTHAYRVRASDVDGSVTRTRWHRSRLITAMELYGSFDRPDISYTFNAEPGETVTVPVTIVDDDGASTTVRKEVSVLNNPPTVRIDGPGLVENGTIHQYTAVANDVDGEIVDYDWTVEAGDGSVSQVSGRLSRNAGSGKELSLKFESIPDRNATVVLSVTVEDDYGGKQRYSKKIRVRNSVVNGESEEPKNQNSPQIEDLSGYATKRSRESIFGRKISNPGQITFVAKATDPDNETLTYSWNFGGEGYAQTVEQSTPESSSKVTFLFEDMYVTENRTVPIQVTVTDESGNSITKTRDLELEYTQSANVQSSPQINLPEGPYTAGEPVHGSVTIPVTEESRKYTIYFGDGSAKTFQASNDSRETYRFDFSHTYPKGGNYTLYVVNGNAHAMSGGYTTIEVTNPTYVEYHYTGPHNETVRTIAAERPGSEWTRGEVDHVVREMVGVENTTVPLTDDISLGPHWSRVGTVQKASTQTKTEVSRTAPGSDWDVAERNVSTERVFDDWEYSEFENQQYVPQDWEFVDRVSYSVSETETKTSTDRPSGAGWSRAGETGRRRQDGWRTMWRDSRYNIPLDWQYLGSDRYVSGYESVTYCSKYKTMYGVKYCFDQSTKYVANYDTRYQFRRPTYATIYRWERTVERTEYRYKYRRATYQTVTLNRYQRKYEVQKTYVKLEHRLYSDVPRYVWTRTVERKGDVVTLEKPEGVDNVTKHKHRCGDGEGEKADEACPSQGDEK